MALQTDKKVLRKFGLVMAGASAVIGAYIYWKNGFQWSPAVDYLAVIGGFFLVTGLIIPIVLAPIEWAWMKLAHVMGFVMTRVLISLVYFLAITPTGLIFKLLRKDLLDRKIDKAADSYWVPAEPDGPWTRADKPY
ncbi:MAG: SxtJ family membrane protein [Bacteroidetes bacterium]|nr:SxtJ family membrane protein [Bacteroidota bacterium]